MTESYQSHFGPEIAALVRQQRAVGRPYITSQQKLVAFDRFCVRSNPHYLNKCGLSLLQTQFFIT